MLKELLCDNKKFSFVQTHKFHLLHSLTEFPLIPKPNFLFSVRIWYNRMFLYLARLMLCYNTRVTSNNEHSCTPTLHYLHHHFYFLQVSEGRGKKNPVYQDKSCKTRNGTFWFGLDFKNPFLIKMKSFTFADSHVHLLSYLKW